MAKKPAKPEQAPPAPPAGPKRAMSTTTMAIIVLVIVTLGATYFLTRSGEAPSEASQPAETTAAAQTPAAAPASDAVPASAKFGPHKQDAYPPLPETGFAPPRPMDTVRAVYQFAAEHPEVLGYIPCYCGCDRQGHKGNDDCFVAQRDAKGDVTAWDGHGMT